MAKYVDDSPIHAHYSDLEDKTVVITGGANGMGRLFASELASRGSHVVITDLNEAVHETAAELNNELSRTDNAGKVVATVADVTDRDEHSKAVELAVQEFGGFQGWINNAGVFPESPIIDCSPEQIDLSLDVNVKGTLFGSQAAAQHFKEHEGGAIVNMASVAALRVRRNRGAYNAAKAGMLHMNNSLAVELGDYGIRVNAVAPGFIDTAMTQWVHDTPGALDNALTNVPLHRIGSPIEVFGAVYFLLSDSARYVTGSLISVDGGSRHI